MVGREPYQIHLLNTYNLGLAEKDREYSKILNGNSSRVLNLADGWPVSTYLSIKHKRKYSQIRGIDLFRNLVRDNKSAKHYFLGTTTDNLQKMREGLTSEFPYITIVGTYSPPFTSNINLWIHEFVKDISDLKIDLLWVGLGTPKQDLVTRLLGQSRLNVNAIVAIGAAFDFISGEKQEAPKIMRKLRMEWLYRLIIEPKRLWKRYTVYQLFFLKSILLNHFE